jgi:aminopeptidase N
MKKYLYILCLLLFFSCDKQSKKLTLEKGISLELASYRKQQISEVLYALDFKIPKEITLPVSSKLVLNFRVNNLKNNVFLDFNAPTSTLKSITVNDKNTEVNHQKEHLIIDKKLLNLGANSIEIFFDAGETSLNRNEEFLYTLLVPDRASTLFPCFDQPDIKAVYKLRITAPKNWQVLCGAFEESAISIDAFTEHTFAETDKMSTYLFSFVAGIFTEEIKDVNGFYRRFLYRENNKEKLTESVDVIFSIHQKAIDFLEVYTAVKFPFQKMDFVAIPSFQYGGMEHVAAIQYSASSLFLDKNATQNKKLKRAKLIGHETAHMWFGNLVTMRWFNDVWMKEVFANFMADKIINPVFPDINHNLNFMLSHYPSAYSEDRTKGTNAIRQYLGNLKNAGSLYGRIIYNKAPIMMRQLEYLLGATTFKEGLQEYIKTYQNSNADWNELVSILDKKSAKNIKNWSDVWVNSSGRPVFKEEIEYDKEGNIGKFIIHQKAEDGSDKIWTQSFNIQLKDARGSVKNISIENMGKSFDISSEAKDFKPTQVLYNTNGIGYGVFPVYSELVDQYKAIKDDVSRGYQYINLYENMLNGVVNPVETYQVYIAAIQTEKNELILNYLSDRVLKIFWTFLTDTQQTQVQKKTENAVFKLLESNAPKNIKKTLFGLYESLAISPEGTANLYSIWSQNKTFKNLFLNEDDFTTLAMKLAVYKHPEASAILIEQEVRITNKDRLARFKWLLPSLSFDEIVRDNFMQSLFKKENREKEAWVEKALQNMHHPLRHSYSIKKLKACLQALNEIQLTGDIFFPKRWLANSVGNYSSKEASKILNTFLADNPNYNPILKKKLLQTTDNLLRAQTIKK